MRKKSTPDMYAFGADDGGDNGIYFASRDSENGLVEIADTDSITTKVRNLSYENSESEGAITYIRPTKGSMRWITKSIQTFYHPGHVDGDLYRIPENIIMEHWGDVDVCRYLSESDITGNFFVEGGRRFSVNDRIIYIYDSFSGDHYVSVNRIPAKQIDPFLDLLQLRGNQVDYIYDFLCSREGEEITVREGTSHFLRSSGYGQIHISRGICTDIDDEYFCGNSGFKNDDYKHEKIVRENVCGTCEKGFKRVVRGALWQAEPDLV